VDVQPTKLQSKYKSFYNYHILIVQRDFIVISTTFLKSMSSNNFCPSMESILRDVVIQLMWCL
jgi:hypothetical protein